MKNNTSKIGTVVMAVVTFITINLASCVSAPRQQYSSSQPPASCGQPYHRPQRPDPRMQGQSQNMMSGGPQVPSNMPGVRQSDWKLGPVLRERWHYDPRTRKVTKVGEETLQPGAELDVKMRASGLDPFPNRVPIGGTMPQSATGNRVPGNPPPIGNEGAMKLEEKKTSRPPAEVFPEDPVTGRWLSA